VKEKVGTWLKQLPNDFRNDSSSSFSSCVDGEPVKGKSTTKATTSDANVTANGSNEEAIAQESCSWDPMKYDYITPANCKPFFGNFDEDLVDKREQRLCRFYRSNGWCSYQKNCRFLHVQTGSSFFEEEDETTMTIAHHEIPLPKVGATIALNINVVRSPSCFYISLKPLATFVGDETILVKLNSEMNAWYWNEEEKERSRPFLVGEIVAALHEDQRFYRARIIDYDEDSIELHSDLRKDQRAKVFFVDYGRSTYVDIADIRTINPDHLSLPFQAIECSLADVGPAKKGWQEASKTLYNMTKGKELRANVRSNEACRLDVDLFAKNPSNGTWENINEKLIELKLAVSSPTIIAPGKCLIIPG